MDKYHAVVCNNCKQTFYTSDSDVKTDLVRKIVYCPDCGHKNILELYLCDPEKNIECNKIGCQGKTKCCFATWKICYAKDPITVISSQEMYDKYDNELSEKGFTEEK